MIGRSELQSSGKSRASQSIWERVTLLVVTMYEALGCLVGGTLLTVAPDGRLMKMPVAIMHGTFRDFLIPGIILLGLGLLNMVSFMFILRRSKSDWVWAGLAIGGLIIWFWVEIIIIREFHWLHAMWALPVIFAAVAALPLFPGEVDRGLVVSGIISSIWFITADLVASNMWPGYRFTGQAFSELTALEAPTRSFLVHVSGIPYNLFVIAFACGLWRSTSMFERKVKVKLHLIVTFILVHVISGFCGGSLFPMHSRGAHQAVVTTDTMHIVFTAIEVISMLLVLLFAATLFDKRFRNYTIFTIVLLLVGGGIAAMYGPAVAADRTTPGLGIVERLNIYGFMLWFIVLARVFWTNVIEVRKTQAGLMPATAKTPPGIQNKHKQSETK